MKIISYYTEHTPYEQVAKDFIIPSCKKWNLDCDIQGIEDKGSWSANTAMKSSFIKEMLLKYKEPVTFLDADAKIVQFPYLLFQIKPYVDLAFHHFNWYGHWRNDWNNNSKIELLSGTMYWNYNKKILQLLDKWICKVNENIHKWEQKVLEEIVYTRKDLTIANLPAEYCCVLMQDNSIPNYIKDPVIIHMQASRKYKRWKSERKSNERI